MGETGNNAVKDSNTQNIFDNEVTINYTTIPPIEDVPSLRVQLLNGTSSDKQHLEERGYIVIENPSNTTNPQPIDMYINCRISGDNVAQGTTEYIEMQRALHSNKPVVDYLTALLGFDLNCSPYVSSCNDVITPTLQLVAKFDTSKTPCTVKEVEVRNQGDYEMVYFEHKLVDNKYESTNFLHEGYSLLRLEPDEQLINLYTVNKSGNNLFKAEIKERMNKAYMYMYNKLTTLGLQSQEDKHNHCATYALDRWLSHKL